MNAFQYLPTHPLHDVNNWHTEKKLSDITENSHQLMVIGLTDENHKLAPTVTKTVGSHYFQASNSKKEAHKLYVKSAINLNLNDDAHAGVNRQKVINTLLTEIKRLTAIEILNIEEVIVDINLENQYLAEKLVSLTYNKAPLKGIATSNTTKKTESFNKIMLIGGKKDEITLGHSIGKGVILTKILGDLPGNIATPQFIAQTAKALTEQVQKSSNLLSVEILEKQQIAALKMDSFLSVAKGSEESPYFVILKFTPKKLEKLNPLVLVGKGISFDAGGISIKPAEGMDEMKYDMCGAGSVIGAFYTLTHLPEKLQPTREVIGLIATCENLPSGTANKPGDIVTTAQGLTVEILNTDAEGRLVLCDALHYAKRLKPEAVVDIATLTGACMIALGSVNSGLYANNQELANQLKQAAVKSHDKVWQMPLEEEYQSQLDSPFADMANIGGKLAGSVTAACFLSRFATEYKWAHLDVAGTAWVSGGMNKAATGRPVPLLIEWLLAYQ